MSHRFILLFPIFSAEEQRLKLSRKESVAYIFTLELIRSDLKNAYLTINKGAPEETHKTIFKSEDDDPVSHLTFAAINHVKMGAGVKQCDQTELEYYGENIDGENVLMRRESLWVDEYPERGGNVYPVLKGFKSIKFEYWRTTTKEWVDHWNTESIDNVNSLPPKVKITMIAEEGEFGKEDYKIETVVNLKMTKPFSF